MNGFGLEATANRRRVFSNASGGSVDVAGIEVVQAIQNLEHAVRLIARKRTVVRIYLTPRAMPRNVRVRAEIAVSSTLGGPERYVVSRNIVSLRKFNHPDLQTQRGSEVESLNVELPPQAAGSLHVRLNRVVPLADGDDVPIGNPDHAVTVSFEDAPLLRIRAVGLRYTDSRGAAPVSFAPDALHFDLLRSYLTRTYPVPSVEWSQIVVPVGNNVEPPFSDGTSQDPRWQGLAVRVLSRLQLIRQADVNAGRDPRTHYYGLIADDGDFFRGRATRVAADPDPATVAMGPAGRSGFSWDRDGSYADWYGAHELGHTFGCRHPGHCNQRRDPRSSFPYEDGKISDGMESCVGFDTGDPELGLSMRALPHPDNSDFMTYCENQWISRHTYDALFERLHLENAQFAPTDA